MFYSSVIGYPRIGNLRELKFSTEKYFRKEISENELLSSAKNIRKEQWILQKNMDVDLIPSNDFSFYDNLLDTAFMFNIIPKKYLDLNLSKLDTYFAMARGYQENNKDIKALSMKKWFNTNYHYIVPEIEDNTDIKINDNKIFEEYIEAKNLGIETKPVIIGPFTLLKLIKYNGNKKDKDFVKEFINVYSKTINKLNNLECKWIQFDEPYLVLDLNNDDISLFKNLYTEILKNKNNVKILLQTYFGDIRDCYKDVLDLNFDGIGLDFIEGEKNLELIEKFDFPNNKILFAGLINGKNIWKNNYKNSLETINLFKNKNINFAISTSTSLMFVPYTLENENQLDKKYSKYFSFAKEKLIEISDLKYLSNIEYIKDEVYLRNQELFKTRPDSINEEVRKKIDNLKDEDFIRLPKFKEREKIQKEYLNLPILPTTTIGSFPQSSDVQNNRKLYKQNLISKEEYIQFNKNKIYECIKLQEEIGLDVLVHGEFERNDMVEFFGENLDGFIFLKKAWVLSYGTRCVKPPIIWGDVSRNNPITLDLSIYSQSLTKNPVKGMLTGPVTILNWSFPREDISLKESAFQIALAIKEEVMDLEKNGIKVIQIDEAALREKLPLRKSNWHDKYLNWAIAAFRLVHSNVKAQTQIHTHMCYSQFNDIIKDIDNMDADVITFESSRSNLYLLDHLKENNFKTEVGPGVYDVHSPRVPSVTEVKDTINKILNKLNPKQLWINPDCGLKTRQIDEVTKSLKNIVTATKEIRNKIQ